MQKMTGTAPEHIYALLHGSCAGSVEMVNSRGIYLQLEGRRILLCHSDFGTVPNGVSLEQWDCLPSALTPNQPVQAERGILSFPSATFELQLRSVPKNTQILVPDKNSLLAGIGNLAENAKPTGLSFLVYYLFSTQRPDMNLHCHVAFPYVKELMQALKVVNADSIDRSVCALLGLGSGLTPSGDDLLSGLIYGLRHSPARDTAGCEILRDTIGRNVKERTNSVSADYLMAIADDAPFDRMAAAWADPAIGAAELMQIGSNSGGEMLLGLLIAAAIQIES